MKIIHTQASGAFHIQQYFQRYPAIAQELDGNYTFGDFDFSVVVVHLMCCSQALWIMCWWGASRDMSALLTAEHSAGAIGSFLMTHQGDANRKTADTPCTVRARASSHRPQTAPPALSTGESNM